MPEPEPRKRHRGQCVTEQRPKGVGWLAVPSVCGRMTKGGRVDGEMREGKQGI